MTGLTDQIQGYSPPLNGSNGTERHADLNKKILGNPGDGLLIPPERTFAGIINSMSRVYSFRWDEAMRHAPANALAMRHDPFFAALIQERCTPTGRWPWQIEIDQDDKVEGDEEQEEIRRGLEGIVRATWALDHLREYLTEFVWPGRYGAQVEWGDGYVGGTKRKVIVNHAPVDGDKILTDFDGCPAVAIYASDVGKYPKDSIGKRPHIGATEAEKPGSVVTTDRFPVLKLNRPDYRNRFIIPIFKMRDGDYFDPFTAGMRGGVGLRHYAYWGWWLRDEMLAWATDFMEKVGSLGIMLFFYEEGNPSQKTHAISAARQCGNGNALACPVPRGDGRAGGVELLPANMSGVQFLTQFIGDYFEGHLERLIVGQKMSSDHTGSGGLGGSGAADFAMNTKWQLLASDARLMDFALTQDLLKTAQTLNFPKCKTRHHFRSIVPAPDSPEKLKAVKDAWSMGVDFAEDDVRKLTGVEKPPEGVPTLRSIQQQAQQQQAGNSALAHHTDAVANSPELIAAMMQTGGDPAAIDKLKELAADPQKMAEVTGVEPEGAEDGENQAISNSGQILSKNSKDTGSNGATAHYSWSPGTTKGGGVKAVGAAEHDGQTLYGAKAEAALRGKTPKSGEDDAGKAKRGTTDGDKTDARNDAMHVLNTPERATAEEVAALGDRLKQVSPGDLKELSRRFLQEHKGLKKEVIGKLVEYALDTATRVNKAKSQADGAVAEWTGKPVEAQEPVAEAKPDVTPVADAKPQPVKADPEPVVADKPADPIDNSPAAPHAIHDRFRDSLANSPQLKPGQRAHYQRSIEKVLDAMPTVAHDLIAKHVSTIGFHSTPIEVGGAAVDAAMMKEMTPEKREKLGQFIRDLRTDKVKPGAAWLPKDGGIHLDGDLGEGYQAHEVYAHSLGHAIDGPKKKISKSAEWQAAWEAEASGLNKYAGKSAGEGLAEFSRLVYGQGDVDAWEKFPQMSKVLDGLGLMPAPKWQNFDDSAGLTKQETSTTAGIGPQTPILPELFGQRIDLDGEPDGAHVDAIQDEPEAATPAATAPEPEPEPEPEQIDTSKPPRFKSKDLAGMQNELAEWHGKKADKEHDKAIKAIHNKIAAWKKKHSLANEVITSHGGKFKSNGKWYTIGNAETGYEVTPVVNGI